MVGRVSAQNGRRARYTLLTANRLFFASTCTVMTTECVAGSTGQRSFFFLSTTLLPKVERQQRNHNKKDQSDAKPGGA